MKEPVDHVVRPRLPWRSPADPAITECGYDASKVSVLTRDELERRLKDYGRQRTAMITCMTCLETARRYPTWEEEPRLALQREVEWEAPRWYGAKERRGRRLLDELLAIAELIAAHSQEFATIQARRAWNERKEQRLPKKAAPKPKPDGDPFDARREP